MKRHQIVVVAAAFLTLVFMAGYAAGQRQIPAQNAGQSDELLRSLDLTTELASTKGRTLRMRKVTLQPGGVLGLHNHVDRPAITYFLQGQVTYHSEGKPDMVANPGGGFAEGRATTHWAETLVTFRRCRSQWIFRSHNGEPFRRPTEICSAGAIP